MNPLRDTPAPSKLASHSQLQAAAPLKTGILGWSAWQRLLVVLPLLAVLWLAVAWALADGSPAP